jgi:hypothetical protein
VGSQVDVPYDRNEDSRPFFTWAGLSPEDRDEEVKFFRDRFEQHPAEIGRFLSWILPRDAVYEVEALQVAEKLFPADELYGLIEEFGDRASATQDEERVQFFVQHIEKRRRGGADEAVADDPALYDT